MKVNINDMTDRERVLCCECEHCEYIGGGDFLCYATYRIVGTGKVHFECKPECEHFKRIEEEVLGE